MHLQSVYRCWIGSVASVVSLVYPILIHCPLVDSAKIERPLLKKQFEDDVRTVFNAYKRQDSVEDFRDLINENLDRAPCKVAPLQVYCGITHCAVALHKIKQVDLPLYLFIHAFCSCPASMLLQQYRLY